MTSELKKISDEVFVADEPIVRLGTGQMCFLKHMSIKKLLYFSVASILLFILAFWSSLREVFSDTETYYLFYESLMDNGLVNAQSCQSFEPLFCIVSFALSSITKSSSVTHFLWALTFYIVSFKSFLILWNLCLPRRDFTFMSLVPFIFIAINYIEPTAVYFLTRQYVASSFLVLGFAKIASGTSPRWPFIVSVLIHFGSAPLAIIAYVFSRSSILQIKFIFTIVISFAIVYLYFFDFYIFEIYYESVKYKMGDHSDRNDGDVTLVQEIKLVVYLFLTILFFKIRKAKLVLAISFIYIMYLMTFVSDLAHLRYYKFLESISWPSAFMAIYFFRKSYFRFYLFALSLRIFRYLTLI